MWNSLPYNSGWDDNRHREALMGFWSIFGGLLARDAVRGTVRGMQKSSERQ